MDAYTSEKDLDKNLAGAILFALRTNTGQTIKNSLPTYGRFFGRPLK